MALPLACYSVQQIRQLEQLAITEGLTEQQLMDRAGKAAFQALQQGFGTAQRIAVLCGSGNNGGDGYVLARYAIQAGRDVVVYTLGDKKKQSKVAAAAQQTYQKAKGKVVTYHDHIDWDDADVIVDAMFGIGLKGEVKGQALAAIQALNQASCDIFALDIPSGLDADQGCVDSQAVMADATITFIGLKKGLLTGAGLAHCGELVCHDLGLSQRIDIEQHLTPSAVRFDDAYSQLFLKARRRDAHKGDFGHVLVIGGDFGMAGATRLAAEAALRTGAGLVTVATRPEHVAAVVSSRPEIMCYGITKAAALKPLLERATVVVVGPGLGNSDWSQALWQAALKSELPLLIDASALHYLADKPIQRDNWLLTPHPGEAATLLATSTTAIQHDRFKAVHELQQRFGGVSVLKGAGTLVQSDDKPPLICGGGNPGMATAGMGDVLSGVIAGFIAQHYSLLEAALLGVAIHAAAADKAAEEGENSLLASDLFQPLRQFIEPAPTSC